MLLLSNFKSKLKDTWTIQTMDPGPALSSTPRKTIGKPILRLSIPTPNAQFASPKGRPSEPSSTTFNVTQPTNRSTIANSQNDNKVDNINGCPHAETNASNKNNQSEVEKLIRSERFAQPSKCRSDGASAGPLANGFEKMSPQRDLHAADGDDNGSPSYKSFESDFRRRIDEMNAANRFEMRLKGNDFDLFSFFFVQSMSIGCTGELVINVFTCTCFNFAFRAIAVIFAYQNNVFVHAKHSVAHKSKAAIQSNNQPQSDHSLQHWRKCNGKWYRNDLFIYFVS